MKHTFLYNILAAGALVVGFTSCHDDIDDPTTTPSGDNGKLQLSSLSIDMKDAEKVISSSAGRAATDINDFFVYISAQGSDEVLHTYRYGDMPEILTLPVGEYTINVESHKIQKAEWENPYFKGGRDFSITANEITYIEPVTAYFSSLKVTVKFSDELRALLGDDTQVTIKANNEGLLVYTLSETRAGYFEVVDNSTTMIAHFEGTLDGTFTTFDTPFTDIEAGQHRIITYKTKNGPDIPEQSGTINPGGGIGIDADVEIIDKDGNVTVEEDILDGSDRPGQEVIPDDPGTEPDPGPGGDQPGEETQAATFEATNSPSLSLEGVNEVTSDFGNAIVTIKCEKGIKNLLVTINTDSDDFYSALDDLGLAQPFDLAYPGDLEEKIGEDGLGLATGSKVINQTEVPFDITLFVPMLAGFPGNHNFTLEVTDNNGQKASLTLKFIAKQQ